MFIKYTSQRYVDQMVDQGRIRLSTFWHFQADERAEIGDPDEGQTGFLFRNDTSAPWTLSVEMLERAAMGVEGHPRVQRPAVLAPGDESGFEAAGGFNTFMYSLTEADAPSRALMRRLGYDAAVEITDVHAFANRAGQALKQHLEAEYELERYGYTKVQYTAMPVTYVDRKRTIVTPSTEHALDRALSVDNREFFRKLRAFEYQAEFRIVYFVLNPATQRTLSMDVKMQGLAPLIVDDAGVPRIGKYLRHVHESEFVE